MRLSPRGKSKWAGIQSTGSTLLRTISVVFLLAMTPHLFAQAALLLEQPYRLFCQFRNRSGDIDAPGKDPVAETL